MAEITSSTKIAGVKFVALRAFADERGFFMETFRKEWFPERSWDIVQTNRNFSKAGVLRGLHYHHHQVDYWCVMAGTMRVGLADLRPSSTTFKATETIEIGDDNPVGIFIPVGVAHGFLSLTDSVLAYLVDNYYNGADELGVAWNDPALGVNWGVENPIISERDLLNPRLAEIAPEQMPK
ncbi:MAG: dTDP-4-dehydrorhamnose 3,5-epimerase family protein [Caldilineaceae bacterium]|nr:dTDP-4-dehydrorhamnose 3,5-epimerase family protein [Caldilineaceae bacterium]